MVSSQDVTFTGDNATIRGFLARPEGGRDLPGVLVVHEADGINDNIRRATERIAAEGFVALAPHLPSRRGGVARFLLPQIHRMFFGVSPTQQATKDLQGAVTYLRNLDGVVQERIGVVGFCLGGGLALALASASDQVSATVSFYGKGPSPLSAVANIHSPVLYFYGEDDWFIRGSVPRLREAMQRHGKSLEVQTYPGASHSFMNDQRRSYRPAAAEDAWPRTISFLQQHLAVP